jgi:hypothetical protein
LLAIVPRPYLLGFFAVAARERAPSVYDRGTPGLKIMTLFFEIACRVASGARILVNVLVTPNRDGMQVGERYEHSYECVGNATWKRIVKYTFSLH